jgi:riboflavin biosynthesis pyrimidine reductase
MEKNMKIKWHLNNEKRYPHCSVSPIPDYFEPMGFPPAWLDRPWIFANMVASANGVVAWKRKDIEDDPVLTILGGDNTRLERVADKLQMRYLRTFGDMSVGAETNRTQPGLIQTPKESWDTEPELAPVYESLYRFRTYRGLSRHPLNIIYSPSGRLDLDNAVFNAEGVKVAIITTDKGLNELEVRRFYSNKNIKLIVEEDLEPQGLLHAHQQLFRRFGVRYLNCEGGETILRALHAAGLLDEVFVTYTDAVIDETAHEGILHIFDFEKEGAELVAEGKTSPESGYTFRRWRFNKR